MGNVNVIFDFQSNVGNIEDFVLQLPASAVPRKGESVGFVTDELNPLCESMKEQLEDAGAFFEIEDVTWNYGNSGIRNVRVYLMEFKT